MRWRWQDLPAAFAAWATVVASMLAVLDPGPSLRLGLAFLVPAVVFLAFLANLQQGSCAACRASARQQERIVGAAVAQPSSRMVGRGADVAVETGWDVEVPVEYLCGRCGVRRRVVSSCFVDRGRAPTAGEAQLIATNELR